MIFTNNELKVIDLLLNSDKSYKEIAFILKLSHCAVRQRIESVYKKAKLHSRIELLHWWKGNNMSLKIDNFFVASDGKEFKDKFLFQEYEDSLKMAEIKYLDNDKFVFFYGGEWYYPKDKDELEVIKRSFGFYRNKPKVCGVLKTREWICVMPDEFSGNTAMFITLSFVENEITKFLNLFSV